MSDWRVFLYTCIFCKYIFKSIYVSYCMGTGILLYRTFNSLHARVEKPGVQDGILIPQCYFFCKRCSIFFASEKLNEMELMIFFDKGHQLRMQ